ncbi:hypothetical protein BJ912DRAFT_1047410 [Pholiota molesta]|nr:hypothetical protein BJ912DRAFT_1047410 [Pholiota molesta]
MSGRLIHSASSKVICPDTIRYQSLSPDYALARKRVLYAASGDKAFLRGSSYSHGQDVGDFDQIAGDILNRIKIFSFATSFYRPKQLRAILPNIRLRLHTMPLVAERTNTTIPRVWKYYTINASVEYIFGPPDVVISSSGIDL